MDYVYMALWFILAILVIVRFRKEGALVWLSAGMFVFMGVWQLVDLLLPDVDLSGGIYIWIFRGILAVFLCVGTVMYIMKKRKGNNL